MSTFVNRITSILALSLVFLVAITPVYANGPTVDHRFFIELPDGSKQEIKGGKIHKYYEGRTDLGEQPYSVGSYCKYDGFGEQLERGISGGYHCATNESCFRSDYGAPYLPKSFNADSSVYNTSDASYFAFYNKSFSAMLNEKYPYLATQYKNTNIRGFDGAKWQGTVDYTDGGDNSFKILTDVSNVPYTAVPEWGNIPGYEGKQSWSAGEVYVNPLGGNVLQGKITWTLVTPLDKPTAKFSGKCGPQTWNGPLSYIFTISDMDLKGAPFAYSKVFLSFIYDAKSAKIREFLGKSSYEGGTLQNGDWFGYDLQYFQTYSPQLSFTWNSSIKIGENQKTIDELVAFIEANKASVPDTYYVGANLANGSGDKRRQNDSIGSYKVNLTKNACATPPASPPVSPSPSPIPNPMCVSIEMQNQTGTKITDYSKLSPEQAVKFACGQVSGVTQYKFRVLEINAQNQITKNIPLNASGRVSSNFVIPNSGKFIAQCTICPNGNCQTFETPPGTTGNIPTPTLIPVNPDATGKPSPTPGSGGSGGGIPVPTVKASPIPTENM